VVVSARQVAVATAKASGCGLRPGRAEKLVLTGNIGTFSLGLQQPGIPLSLQTRRIADDDVRGAFVACGRPGSVLGWAEIRSNDL